MPTQKKTMIDKENRPTLLELLDEPIAKWKVRDLMAVLDAQVRGGQTSYTPIPEYCKPEKEFVKPEKEIIKPEKELRKPEKEWIKPEKEFLKPELTKPEKEMQIPDLVEHIAVRVVEILERRGLFKR